jgi:hypothetical protein
MMVQGFTGFPFCKEAESVIVFDIAEYGIAQTTCFLSSRFNHGQ